nr:hypothetical protein [Tanacetum cinerariifolium]
MKRAFKGYSGVITSLFDTMLVPHLHGEPSTPKSSPFRIASSPSISPQHTLIDAPSTSQPPNLQTTPVAEETTPMPHDSPLQSVYSLGRDKGDKEGLLLCSYKAHLKSEKVGVNKLDMDVDISLVPPHAADQGRKLDDTQARAKGKAIMQESEPTKKIKKRIQVQMSIDEELARKLHEEEMARFNAEQEAIDIARKEKVVVKEKRKKSDDSSKPTRKKILARKRAGGNDSQESVKKQKLEDDTEKKELKAYLDIVPEDEFVMEVESLAIKYPIIDWKTHFLIEHFMYYQILRADRSSKNYKIFSEMLDDFDRQDVMDLYRLVEERYTTTSPEGYDLMLWGDLKTLFEPDEENEFWKNQH